MPTSLVSFRHVAVYKSKCSSGSVVERSVHTPSRHLPCARSYAAAKAPAPRMTANNLKYETGVLRRRRHHTSGEIFISNEHLKTVGSSSVTRDSVRLPVIRLVSRRFRRLMSLHTSSGNSLNRNCIERERERDLPLLLAFPKIGAKLKRLTTVPRCTPNTTAAPPRGGLVTCLRHVSQAAAADDDDVKASRQADNWHHRADLQCGNAAIHTSENRKWGLDLCHPAAIVVCMLSLGVSP